MGKKKQSAQRRARETKVSQPLIQPPFKEAQRPSQPFLDKKSSPQPSVQSLKSPLNTSAAFLVVEILESILLELDQTTLLTSAQRVCRAWHRCIATSSQLQRWLFFEPNPQHGEQQQQEPWHNPLLRRLLGPHLFFAEPRVLPLDRSPHDWTAWAPNPAVQIWRYAPQDVVKMRLPIANVGPGRRGPQAAFAREGASWRRMLPSQPAGEQLLHFVDPLWYDERDRVGGQVGKATCFWRAKWQSSFRHRLHSTTMTDCKRKDSDGGKQQDCLRMGELYDAMYYILWGSDMPNGCVNQACAVLLTDEVHKAMMGTASGTAAGSAITGHEYPQPQPAAGGDVGGGFQWAIFSSLACGREVPGSLPHKEAMAAAGRSASISAEPHEWVRKMLARRQRERRSCEWMFRSADYDEERTKRFLRLQSPRDDL
ncbi:F-box-like domain-containing protein [Microdochium nivale]|nr:F-box-like domain-containing protein [Microdochium nivale]